MYMLNILKIDFHAICINSNLSGYILFYILFYICWEIFLIFVSFFFSFIPQWNPKPVCDLKSLLPWDFYAANAVFCLLSALFSSLSLFQLEAWKDQREKEE